MEEKRRFVEAFPAPKPVIHKNSLTGFGMCWGARAFGNGWFAVWRGDGVTLYNRAGQIQETQLDDVYVSESGYCLKRYRNSSHWLFCRPSGELIAQAEDAKVFKDSLVALKTGEHLWSVYQLTLFVSKAFVNLEAEEVEIYPAKEPGYAVFALKRGDKTTLQLLEPLFGNVTAELKNVAFYLRMPDGSFAVSASSLAFSGHCGEYLIVQPKQDGLIDLYGVRLRPTALSIGGVVSFSNGIYLLKGNNGCWELFANNGRLLQTGIYDLHLYENGESDVPCLFFGSGEHDEHVVLRLSKENWLQLTFGLEKKLITPEGVCFDETAAANDVFIF